MNSPPGLLWNETICLPLTTILHYTSRPNLHRLLSNRVHTIFYLQYALLILYRSHQLFWSYIMQSVVLHSRVCRFNTLLQAIVQYPDVNHISVSDTAKIRSCNNKSNIGIWSEHQREWRFQSSFLGHAGVVVSKQFEKNRLDTTEQESTGFALKWCIFSYSSRYSEPWPLTVQLLRKI